MSVELTPAGTRGTKMPRAAIAIMGVMPRVYRLLGGRGMGPTLILTTIGAKTGQTRDAHLRSFGEGEGWLVVGSKGGDATHPSWFVNMARNPDRVWVQAGKRKVRVRPQTLKGPVRASAWKRIVAEASNFGDYERKTDRVIPVVRLTPAE